MATMKTAASSPRGLAAGRVDGPELLGVRVVLGALVALASAVAVLARSRSALRFPGLLGPSRHTLDAT